MWHSFESYQDSGGCRRYLLWDSTDLFQKEKISTDTFLVIKGLERVQTLYSFSMEKWRPPGALIFLSITQRPTPWALEFKVSISKVSGGPEPQCH